MGTKLQLKPNSHRPWTSGRQDRTDLWVSIAAVGLVVVAEQAFLRCPVPGAAIVPAQAVIGVQGLAILLRGRSTVVPWALCLLAVPLAGPDPARLFSIGLAQLALLAVAAYHSRRVTVSIGLVTLAVLCADSLRTTGFRVVGAGGLTMLIWTVGVIAVGTAIQSRRIVIATMRERTRWALETHEAEARSRVAKERLRIARELHDVLGHHIAVIRIHAGLARRTLTTEPARATAALTEVETVAEVVLRELGGILSLLREDPSAAPAPPAPGLDDLDGLIEMPGGPPVRIVREVDVARVGELTAVTAYRVVQECLTNARRHGTGPIDLSLRTEGTALTVTVANPAVCRPEASPAGYGLTGMRERIQALRGRLEITCTDGIFRVRAELPIEEPR
jgi:signal transduction histidine kinase